MTESLHHTTSGAARLFRTLLAAAVAALPAATAAAEDDDVMVIRITSGRLAAPVEPQGAVTVTTPAAIPRGPAASVGDLLDGVPGVFAGSRYNGAQDLRLSVRGFGSRGNFGIRGIRIYRDGLPLTLPDGQSAVDDLDPSALARAEVRRGPASALYGASAGGVIHLESPDLFTAEGWHAGLGAGAWGSFEAEAGLHQAWAQRALDLDAGSRGQEGYRDHSRQLHHRLSLRLGLRPVPAGLLELSLHAVDSPYAEDPGGLTAAERARDRDAASPLHQGFDAGEAVSQQRLGLHWRQALAGGAGLRLAGYWLERDFENLLPFSATGLERSVGGLSLELEREGTLDLGPWRWVVGADLDHQDDHRRRYTNTAGQRGALTARQRERVAALGVFSQWTLTPTPDLDLGLGLRGDVIDIDFDDRFLADGDGSGQRTFRELSPSLGASWRLGDGVSLFGRLGSSFETPTTTELANPTGAGGFNGAVEPQRAVGIEGGVRWDRGAAGRAELAFYHTRVRDQLVPRPIPGQPGRFFFVNAASSRYVGVELYGTRRLAPHLDARLSASAGSLRFDDFSDAAGNRFDGNRVPGIPEQQLGASLEYAPPTGWGARADLRWVGARYADDANAVRVDDYAVMDVAAAWRRTLGNDRRLELSAGIHNLLDTDYDDNLRINAGGGRYFEPAPERGVFVSVAVRGGR